MVRLPGVGGRGQSLGEDRPEFVGMVVHVLAHDSASRHDIIRYGNGRLRLQPAALLRGDVSEVVGTGSRPRLVDLASRQVRLHAR